MRLSLVLRPAALLATLLVALPSRAEPHRHPPIRHGFDEHAVSVKDLVEAGASRASAVTASSRTSVITESSGPWLPADCSNHDALPVAAILGAEGLGLRGDPGSIEEGTIADPLVLSGDPLRELRDANTLTHVMRGGRLRDAETLDEVWPEPRAFELHNWRESEPESWRVP